MSVHKTTGILLNCDVSLLKDMETATQVVSPEA